jgi:hypothetical protein
MCVEQCGQNSDPFGVVLAGIAVVVALTSIALSVLGWWRYRCAKRRLAEHSRGLVAISIPASDHLIPEGFGPDEHGNVTLLVRRLPDDGTA